jgi:tripartite-type tricarboxylate transporter receptor subunit TctC
MTRLLRQIAVLMLALAGSAICAQTARAADGKYPYKPIRIIQGFSIGGISDTLARIVGDRLGVRLGQAIVVEARAGAGGIVGMTAVAGATPDGYTLLLGNAIMTISPNLKQKPPFDPIKMFVPVSMIGTAPSVLMANPLMPVSSIKELIAYAKARPGAINCATSGVGTSNDLAVHLLNSMAGIDIVTVPYKGSGPSLTAVLGNETPLSFGPLLPAIPQMKAKRLIGLGITSLERSQALPEVPAIAEVLPGYEDVGFYSIVAHHDIPRPIIEFLHKEINAVLAMPDVQKHLTEQGLDARVMTRQEFADFIARDAARWKDLVQKAHLVL